MTAVTGGFTTADVSIVSDEAESAAVEVFENE
jgi:hypothetical protein